MSGRSPLLRLARSRHRDAMTCHQDVIDELKVPTRELRRAIPDVWKGFGELHDAVFVDGALPGYMPPWSNGATGASPITPGPPLTAGRRARRWRRRSVSPC